MTEEELMKKALKPTGEILIKAADLKKMDLETIKLIRESYAKRVPLIINDQSTTAKEKEKNEALRELLENDEGLRMEQDHLNWVLNFGKNKPKQ